MTDDDPVLKFIKTWSASTRTESSAAKEHFIDLCRVLEVKTPAEDDPAGEWYTFEFAGKKPDGRTGYADVWRKDCFAWEYKGSERSLAKAYSQLKDYADFLQNPPLLIVSDMKQIQVHTNFTNSVKEVHVFELGELRDPAKRRLLRAIFTDPERFRPEATKEVVTEEAARNIANLAQRLRGRGYEDHRVAHFVNKLVFCMFAEDIDLLPDNLFTEILERARNEVAQFERLVKELFGKLRDEGGNFGFVQVPWINGGLFADDDVLQLIHTELIDLTQAARLDWASVDPTVLGTLFEKALDPEKRQQMASLFDPGMGKPQAQPGLELTAKPRGKGVGIYYTAAETIMTIVEPVVIAPLRAEWEDARAKIEALLGTAPARGAKRDTVLAEVETLKADFLDRLAGFKVLDPACGSGNFLALTLRELKALESDILQDINRLGLEPGPNRISTENVLGIEVNAYAAELARLTIAIGELQWLHEQALPIDRRPVLSPINSVQEADAVLDPDGTPARWPAVNAVVGNPPFLGNKRMIKQLGEGYASKLRKAYTGRVPGGADLVCYWFEVAREAIEQGRLERAGLVATNSIRGGANREVLKRIKESGRIYNAHADQPWVVDSAAVRVSLVCFGTKEDLHLGPTVLEGKEVSEINSDLTGQPLGGGIDIANSTRLLENKKVSFMGDTKGGSFDVDGKTARHWLSSPLNPNGNRNSDVVRPWINGMDVTRRPRDNWIVDFGSQMSEREAALYEAPFAYIQKHVAPIRAQNRREAYREYWWRHVEVRPAMWKTLAGLQRYIATPTVAKHRLFVWSDYSVCPDHQLIVIAREDDTSFGILHSRFHELWTLRMCTWLGYGNDPRYTPSTTFETFPFPEGLTPNIPAADYAGAPRAQAVAEAAAELNRLREAWLNPEDLVERVPEVVEGFPDRILPKSAAAAKELKKRTLTNLYNQRPSWLDNAHKALDEAVAAAYGWPADLSDEEVLARLFALNQERAAAQAKAG